MQVNAGEVPDALDAAGDEPLRRRPGMKLGQGEDGDLRPVFLQHFLQLAAGIDRHARDLRPDQQRVGVEGGHQPHTVFCEIEIGHQGLAQISRTNDNGPAVPVDAHDARDGGPQLRYVVSVTLLPKSAEAVEILPHLRCRQSHPFRQRTGRDPGDPRVLEIAQMPEVPGHSVDHRRRDLLIHGKLLLGVIVTYAVLFADHFYCILLLAKKQGGL